MQKTLPRSRGPWTLSRPHQSPQPLAVLPAICCHLAIARQWRGLGETVRLYPGWVRFATLGFLGSGHPIDGLSLSLLFLGQRLAVSTAGQSPAVAEVSMLHCFRGQGRIRQKRPISLPQRDVETFWCALRMYRRSPSSCCVSRSGTALTTWSWKLVAVLRAKWSAGTDRPNT